MTSIRTTQFVTTSGSRRLLTRSFLERTACCPGRGAVHIVLSSFLLLFASFLCGCSSQEEQTEGIAFSDARCTGDEEPNDLAERSCDIQVGSLVEASIEEGYEDLADCFRFEVEADVTYSLTMSVGESNASAENPWFRFNIVSKSKQILVEDQSLRANSADYVGFIPEKAEVAILCARAAERSAQFAYEFRIDPDWNHDLEQSDSDYEPNNTEPTSYPIDVATVISSSLDGPEDHRDCYRFDVESDVNYSLTMSVGEGDAGSDNPWFYFDIVTENEESLLGQQSLRANSTDYFGFTLTSELTSEAESEIAMLCVRAGQRSARFVYEFRIDPDWRNGLMQDEALFEPNNTPATAYPIELGDVIDSSLEDGPDRKDCYRFDIESDAIYSLTMSVGESDAGSEDPWLNVDIASESGQTLLREQSLATNFTDYFTFAAQESDIAILCVRAGLRSAEFVYEFRIDADWRNGLVQDEAFEPNNTPPTAYPVSIGDITESSLEDGPEDHKDCFRFEVDADMEYVLSMSVGESNADSESPWFIFNVTSESQEILLGDQSLTAESSGEYTLTPDTSEAVILCVRAAQRSAHFAYEFSIEATP